MKLRTIAQGFGFAITIMILRVWPHLSSYHPIVYHSFLPLRSVVWGVLIDLGVVTLLSALFFAYLQKSETGIRAAIWAFVAAELASALVLAGTAMHRSPLPFLSPDPVYKAVLLAALVVRWLRPLEYRHGVRALGVGLALVGCSMVWMVPELLFQALRAQRIDTPVPTRQATLVSARRDAAATSGRIVWLIFDELSYDQTFEHRFPGVSMPAFDGVKRKSLVFTDLLPAGNDTEHVMPTFLLGKRVDVVRSGLDGDPMLKFAGSTQWQGFHAQATIFADAQRLGWTTGVVGWYNPYCRLLAGTLNYCFWQMHDSFSDGALPDQSVWHNAVAPLTNMWRAIRHEPGFGQVKHAVDLAATMAQAEALLRDESIGFVFIHLPVPHPPGVDPMGGYISNLGVADRALSQLLKTLDTTSLAPKTTLIVCSDHSWRIGMWRPTGDWTKEDEAASHRGFDPRPVLMIRLPGQQDEHDVTAPFDEIRIHEILEQMLRGQNSGLDKELLAGRSSPVALQPDTKAQKR